MSRFSFIIKLLRFPSGMEFVRFFYMRRLVGLTNIQFVYAAA